MKILVTGASGQLGSTLQSMIGSSTEGLEFVFKSSAALDITDANAVDQILSEVHFDYCINCAAFTNVDKAETQTELAKQVNVMGPRHLAMGCAQRDIVLIHISTDFVFDGYLNVPYREEDIARPIGFYGDTKYKGERAIISNLEHYFIIRTSWLYSEFGHNFMKTMLRLGSEKEALSVVYDQIGTPTYAGDLAELILLIVKRKSTAYGVYHYSNEGVASWYDFAKTIFDLQGSTIKLHPILSEHYPTPAERPKYSVLDKSKVKKEFNLEIPHWKDSLQLAITAISQAPV
ncbi:MAG: dTDP-4-dehydrorhamnose reductase [Bacteroidota bacterium]